MPRKKRKRGTKDHEEIAYCIEISRYDVSYSFSLNFGKLFPGPLWENAAIEMEGKLVSPENLKDREISGTLLASRDDVKTLEDPNSCNYEPKAVGGITLRGKESSFIVSIPFDALPLLSQLLRDGNIKFLVLRGPPLYRGSSDTKSIRFEKDYDPYE